MTNEEILQKAIEKANKTGFIGAWKLDGQGKLCEAQSQDSNGICSFTTIFNHDFAKAFFGEEIWDTETGEKAKGYTRECNELPAWKYHLQQMVISEDPIKYLELYLDK